MRSLFFPAARVRFARLRWNPLLMLVSLLLGTIACAILVLALVGDRASRAQDERDMFWITVLETRTLGSELVRPVRNELERASAGTDPARMDWQQLARGGLLVGVANGSDVRVVARPAGAAAANIDAKLLQALATTRNAPAPVGDLFCLPLSDAEVASVRRALSPPKGARVIAAACFDADWIARAARVAFPPETEMTFWRDRQPLLRIAKLGGRDAPVTVTREVDPLPAAIRDKADLADLTTLDGVLKLLVRGGSTTGIVQHHEELRPMGKRLVYYIGRWTGDDVEPWSGISVARQGDELPAPTPWGWLLVAMLAVLGFAAVALAIWSWRIAGRLTRRIRVARPSAA